MFDNAHQELFATLEKHSILCFLHHFPVLHAVVFAVSGVLIPSVRGSGILLAIGVADSLALVGRIGTSRALPPSYGLSRGASTICPCFVLALSLVVTAVSMAVTVRALLASFAISTRARRLCSVSIGLGSHNSLPIRLVRNFPGAHYPAERHCNIVGLPGRHGGRVLLLKLVGLARDACLGVVRLSYQAIFLLRAKLPW
jgi:hypothetical protein